MTVNELIIELLNFNQEAEVVIYDDDNDRVYPIACVDEDEDDTDIPQILIIV